MLMELRKMFEPKTVVIVGVALSRRGKAVVSDARFVSSGPSLSGGFRFWMRFLGASIAQVSS